MVAGGQGDDPKRIAEALASDYRRLRGGLCRTMKGRLGVTTDEFDELYQEAWREIVARRTRGEIIHDCRAFAIVVMTNQWRMELRRRCRHPTAPLEAAEVSARAMRDEPTEPQRLDERMDNEQRAKLAIELIEAVADDRRREVLKLRLAEELPAARVREIVGVTERTYRRLLTNGMSDIEEMIGVVERGDWCESRRGLIVAYFDGRADQREAIQAQRHLEACASCRTLHGRRRVASTSTSTA